MGIARGISNGITRDILVRRDKVLVNILSRLPQAKTLNQIVAASDKFCVPYEVVLGIYLIETSCRPLWFRLIEYLALLFRIVLWLLFKIPIPDYTVGKFQVGLSTIFNFNGFKTDLHQKYLCDLTNKQIISLFKSLRWKQNLEICCWSLSQIFQETNGLSNSRAIRYIGTRFNGHITYGLILEEIVGLINVQDSFKPSAHIA